MKNKKLTCVILAGGQGKRMKSALPKSMHQLAGRPMLGWLLESVEALDPHRVVIVAAPDTAARLKEVAGEHPVMTQARPLGTADAVKAALPALKGFKGDVLILLGDMPLISPATLRALIKARYTDKDTVMSVLGAEYDPPPAFGRLMLGPHHTLTRIVEDKDCTPIERHTKLCNTGAFCVDGGVLPGLLSRVKNKNAQKEFYITDLPEIAAQDDMLTHIHVTRDLDEVRGVNTRADLAALESIVQNRMRRQAMDNGATLIDPASVFFSHDTKLGRDVVIDPQVFFGPGVKIGDHVHIRAFSHLEGAHVKEGAVIGPFARLRPGTKIGAHGRIGNFVEIKNATLDEGVKANHLAYIGDADLGAHVNFSCGAITANYDGFKKHKTVIGAGAMIGSNVNLVAPVSVGRGAYIAAGSTITKDVPADALAVAREKPVTVPGWAARKRKKGSRP